MDFFWAAFLELPIRQKIYFPYWKLGWGTLCSFYFVPEALIITEPVKTKFGVILFLIELMFVPCSKNCSNFKRETTAIHTTPPVTKIISAKNVGARVSNSFHIQLIFISKENWKKKVVGTILDLPAQPIRPIKLVNSGWIGRTN